MKIDEKIFNIVKENSADLYAELYVTTRRDVLGNDHVEYFLGEPRLDLDDRPRFIEYSADIHRHIASVKIKLEVL